MTKMKERILSLVLTFVMVVSLFTGMAPVEVHAAASYNFTEITIGQKIYPGDTIYNDQNVRVMIQFDDRNYRSQVQTDKGSSVEVENSYSPIDCDEYIIDGSNGWKVWKTENSSLYLVKAEDYNFKELIDNEINIERTEADNYTIELSKKAGYTYFYFTMDAYENFYPSGGSYSNDDLHGMVESSNPTVEKEIQNTEPRSELEGEYEYVEITGDSFCVDSSVVGAIYKCKKDTDVAGKQDNYLITGVAFFATDKIARNVVVQNTANGTVNATITGGGTATTVEEVERVQLTLTPDEGYEIGSVSVKDTEGNEISVKEDYSFLMPRSAVTVSVTFTQEGAPSAPITITKQPEAVTIDAGEKATFSVTATGNDLKYCWQVDYGSGRGFENAYGYGSDTATFTTYSTDKAFNGYKYRCIITDGSGNTLTSEEVLLTVNFLAPPTEITGVSISKTANGYKVTGLEAAGEGYRWGYCPLKLREGWSLDEAIAKRLNEHLAYGPFESEITNAFNESYEITTYTNPNNGYESESINNFDYIEIVKLDENSMIREVAVLPLPKNAAQEVTYDITLDRTNYADGYVDLYTYNSEGSAVANTQDNNATITMPEGGKVRVFADSKFTVVAEGATISEMLSAGEEGYYYELTGIAADTTIVVNKGNTGSEETFVDEIDVQIDWDKVPTLEAGMDSDTVPEFEENTAEVTATGITDVRMYKWAVQVTEDHKITEEDEYYEELLELWGETDIQIYNEDIDWFIEDFDGWAVLSDLFRNPFYTVNEEDTYAFMVALMADDGYLFVDSTLGEYTGKVTSNLDFVSAIGDDSAVVLFFELGTLAEMEEEKTPPVEAPAITGQPKNATVEEGQKATFTVTATGDDLSYQWMIDRNDGKGFVNLASTTATHTTTVVDMSCNGFKYKCIVSNSVGAVTSNVVTLTVTEKEVVHTHDLTLVPAKAATCTEEGNKAYYTCSGCDSLFTDAEGTKTTTAEAVKIAALGHDMTAATCKEPGVCKRSGCDHTVDALGHDWSGEWTVIKEATATEEGKKETYCTRKCGQKKVAVIPIEGEEDEDAGNIEKDAEVDPEAPVDEATIDNKKDELLEGDIFTDEEKELIEAGEEARVWLEIGKTDEDAIAADDKAKIEKEAADIMGDDAKITYFDADLFKQVGNGKKTEITEPGIDIEITIVIPKELLNQDETIAREYKIIRLHEGEVDVISGTFDPATGEFSFKTDRFSTYAIVYDDVPVDADDKDDVPKTGVVSTSAYAGTLMLLSGLGLVFCSSKKKSNE